ncbi:MAG: acyltransferase family protein [Bryobacteraceae bacterium]
MPEITDSVATRPTNGINLVAPPSSGPAPARNVAIDAYRGVVMLLMMAEVLRFSEVSRAFPGNEFWAFLAFNQTHVEWAGCSLHDLIQPSFSFLVGVALPYSLAKRMEKGAQFRILLSHALRRSLVLVLLGIGLRSVRSTQINFTFEDTLTQIGLGYPFLFLLGFRSPRWQWATLALILFGYWLAWAWYPAPPSGFDYRAVGVPADWHHNFSGFASHWNKNSNLGNAFDHWFLNLFPRAQPFVANSGGYLTLSFVPTLGTMILGLIAGRWIRTETYPAALKRLVLYGLAGVALGVLLHRTGICPIVKRIWTPAWTLFSGGLCFLFLSAFTWTAEWKRWRRWAFPLVVVGMNSIAAYLLAHLGEEFAGSRLPMHLGKFLLPTLETGLQLLIFGAAVLLLYWLMLFWMHRQKIFFKI